MNVTDVTTNLSLYTEGNSYGKIRGNIEIPIIICMKIRKISIFFRYWYSKYTRNT